MHAQHIVHEYRVFNRGSVTIICLLLKDELNNLPAKRVNSASEDRKISLIVRMFITFYFTLHGTVVVTTIAIIMPPTMTKIIQK